jgi:hypothetical protein
MGMLLSSPSAKSAWAGRRGEAPGTSLARTSDAQTSDLPLLIDTEPVETTAALSLLKRRMREEMETGAATTLILGLSANPQEKADIASVVSFFAKKTKKANIVDGPTDEWERQQYKRLLRIKAVCMWVRLGGISGGMVIILMGTHHSVSPETFARSFPQAGTAGVMSFALQSNQELLSAWLISPGILQVIDFSKVGSDLEKASHFNTYAKLCFVVLGYLTMLRTFHYVGDGFDSDLGTLALTVAYGGLLEYTWGRFNAEAMAHNISKDYRNRFSHEATTHMIAAGVSIVGTILQVMHDQGVPVLEHLILPFAGLGLVAYVAKFGVEHTAIQAAEIARDGKEILRQTGNLLSHLSARAMGCGLAVASGVYQRSGAIARKFYLPKR